ncbi:hypothetical protein HYV50_00340 [Candidatus Pacearchaeota archaeon]|nr:hypothetical protein [Candidatus Pacearchaeota archaeon]
MEVVLDTNFIISCLIKKVDFLGQLRELGLKPVVPREVLQEMKDLKRESKVSRYERSAVDMAFEIFEKENVKKIKIGGKNVDDGLIKKGRQGVFIATLDRVVKVKVPNKVVLLGDKKKLEIQRD